MPATPSHSAVVVPVPSAEEGLARWRQRFDPSGRLGMPAHITLLSPFLDPDQLTPAVLSRLRQLCGQRASIRVEFKRLGRFPDTLYLDPDPAAPFRELTETISGEWPSHQPYGGAFAEIIPHLTVAHGVEADVLRDIERELRSRLPIVAQLDAAELFWFDGDRWQSRARLPFAPTHRPAPPR